MDLLQLIIEIDPREKPQPESRLAQLLGAVAIVCVGVYAGWTTW